MNHFIHAFRITFERFRWEIFAMWLLDAALIAGYACGSYRVKPSWGSLSGPRLGYDILEVVVLCWIILRLMISEPILMTQGGWKTRPMPRMAAWSAPLAVLVATTLPLLCLRILVIQRSVDPDVGQWARIFTNRILPAAGLIVLGALVAWSGGNLLSRRGTAKWTRIAFGISCVALIGAWFHPATASSFRIRVNDDRWYRSVSSGMNLGNHVLGIQEHLPPDAKYAGDWEIWSPPAVRMREIVRLPLSPVAGRRPPGIRLEVKRIHPEGRQLDVDFDVTAADPVFIDSLWDGIMVMRYQGDSYAFRRINRDWRERSPIAALPVTTIHFAGTFDSPIDYLWNELSWEQLLDGAEVIVFLPDKTLPQIQSIRRMDDPNPNKERPAGLVGRVEEVFDGLDYDIEGKLTKPMTEKGSSLPHEALPHVLARYPWSDNAWACFVKPFLLRHADETDKAALLDRMKSEPRLGEIMVIKGWKADALPLLRRFAEDRLPLDVEALAALAEERDPALAGSLSALATRLDQGVERLEPLLRQYPGFDWKGFTHDGWMRRKYSLRGSGPIAPFDLWAAQEGDFSAFLHIAEEAARGKKWEREQLATLVAGEHEDVVAFVREHLGKLHFDSTTRQWKAEDS